MADLASSDVTYSFKPQDAEFQGRAGRLWRGTISFGNGALTYPSGGIPLEKGKMGCPNAVKSLKVIESNVSGYIFEYDVSATKLRILEDPSGSSEGVFVELDAASDAPAAMVLEVEVKGW